MTLLAKPEASIGLAAGVGAMADEMYGKPQANVVLYGSCTVGALFSVMPTRSE